MATVVTMGTKIPTELVEEMFNTVRGESVLAKLKGEKFAQEITDGFVSDFEKSEKLLKDGKVQEMDFMAHVSTFAVINGMIYMTYYANTKEILPLYPWQISVQ